MVNINEIVNIHEVVNINDIVNINELLCTGCTSHWVNTTWSTLS